MDAPPSFESRRHREVHVRYGAVLNDIPPLFLDGKSHHSLPSDFKPQRSKDTSLTAFAQLACLHSGTDRAIISLTDDVRQHVVAEATPNLLLRSNRSHEASSDLWLGTVSAPRRWSPCEAVLEAWTNGSAPPQSAIIFSDLKEEDGYSQRPFATANPSLRFYAGVPLVSSKTGLVVGSLSVLDNEPRSGLEEHQIKYLQDLAITIVEHLDLFMIRDQYSRSEKLLRALMSFTEGCSNMRPFENESQRPLLPSGAEPSESRHDHQPSAHAKSSKPSLLPPGKRPKTSRQKSMRDLQKSILPTDSQSMFSRAASVMQKSSDLDGVLILDASIVGIGGHNDNFVPTEDGLEGSSSGETSSSPEESGECTSSPLQRQSSSSCESAQRTTQVLGFATKEHSDFGGDSPSMALESFPEKDLSRMFHAYPRGKVIGISVEGEPISSTDETTDESDSSKLLQTGSMESSEITHKNKTDGDVKATIALAIRKMLPEAVSVAFAPLWDYERSRWFAGCICWSNRSNRKLSEKVDLAYFKIFGHSIMSDLSRLDALAADQAKTSFVASISHELRSPLHGILGTLNFLEDTALDSFQISMINSLGACGQTLLDTIDHVLDHANITATKKRKSSSKRLRGPQAIQVSTKSSRRRHQRTLRNPAIDLKKVTEETLEAVISGQSYTLLQAEDWDGALPPASQSRRRSIYTILDIAAEDNWNYNVSGGSWRRVVMNLIGNALKYTESGYIHVSLRSSSSTDGSDNRIVSFTIKDTGKGMSQQFLANQAFQPFKQENSHAPGIGLGLSIVRQIIDSLGGNISVTSAPGKGTEVGLRFVLPRSETSPSLQHQPTQFMNILAQLQGRRICILTEPPTAQENNEDDTTSQGGMARFTSALTYTLTKHLDMDVVQTQQWDMQDTDLVICPEPQFSYLSNIRRQRTFGERAPITIFVAMDALEAATLRTDVRVRSKESVVEIMAQPCGPYKLAYVLDLCLNRYASPEENIWSPISTTPSPLPSLEHPLPIRHNFAVSSSNTSLSDPSLSRDDVASTASALRDGHSLTSVITDDSVYDIENSKTPTAPPRTLRHRPLHGPRHATANSMDVKSAMPLLTAPSSPGLSASSDPSMHKKGSSRVLIVDDNPINRKLLVTFLKKRSVLYAEAENGAEAVRMYQQASPMQFDVILMDISMPILDGLSASRQIRDHEQTKNSSRCCIIALTGLASASARLEAWSSGVDHYMTKPVNFKHLETVLGEEAGKSK
ncbi:unnamed protein product [Periconia digitata]|uniref:Uncharacterized protein n=1 Tax=Periconia digitata TaxID=1303443 RepID=A0A9W4XM71_9PLEO|nr:unnamed protein product [Periconia digitata]